MNDNRMPKERLVELIDQLLNNVVSNDDFSLLADELQQNAASRMLFIEYVNLHSELKQNFRLQHDNDIQSLADDLDGLIRPNLFPSTAPVAETPAIVPVPNLPIQNSQTSSLAFWLPTVFSLLLIGAAGLFVFNGGLQNKPTANYVSNLGNQLTSGEAKQSSIESAAEKKGVAILTSDVNARWDDVSAHIQLGKPLAPGIIGLKSGLVQIDFFCGATMILEGPARLEISNENSGFVHYGKLRVYVPERAKGFTLASKECKVVDLGTEFAMNVDSESGAEVHVLEGEVRVKDSVSEGAKEELLTGGKAVRFVGDAPSEKMDVEESKFVGPGEYQRLSKKAQNDGLDRWMKGIDALKQDDALLAMYTFQESSKWDRLLINSRSGNGEIGNGAIVGCEWTQGRWKGKRGLFFGSASHRVRINVPGLYDSLTMSTWVKVDNYRHDLALTHPETNQENYIHWTLDSNASTNNVGEKCSLHFSVTDQDGGKPSRCHYGSGQACFEHFDLGRWVHIGVTYDPLRRMVTHYKDGRVVGTADIHRVQKVGLGIANIGNWPFKEWAKGTKFEFRNMEGAMDEFAVFSRVLSAEEILKMYEDGRPARQ